MGRILYPINNAILSPTKLIIIEDYGIHGTMPSKKQSRIGNLDSQLIRRYSDLTFHRRKMIILIMLCSTKTCGTIHSILIDSRIVPHTRNFL